MAWQRVDAHAVDPQLPVEVRAGGEAGVAHGGDDLALGDGVADGDIDAREVPVAGHDAPAVI